MRKPKKLEPLCDCHLHEHQVCDICQDRLHGAYEGEGYHLPKDVENAQTFFDQVIRLKSEKTALLEALVQAQKETHKWHEEYLNACNDARKFSAKLDETYKAIKTLYKSLEVI